MEQVGVARYPLSHPQAMAAMATCANRCGGLAFSQVYASHLALLTASDLGGNRQLLSIRFFSGDPCDSVGRVECHCEVRKQYLYVFPREACTTLDAAKRDADPLTCSAVLASLILDEKLHMIGKVSQASPLPSILHVDWMGVVYCGLDRDCAERPGRAGNDVRRADH